MQRVSTVRFASLHAPCICQGRPGHSSSAAASISHASSKGLVGSSRFGAATIGSCFTTGLAFAGTGVPTIFSAASAAYLTSGFCERNLARRASTTRGERIRASVMAAQ